MEHFLPYLMDVEKEISGQKDRERARAFWLKLAWEVESCSEAAELFPDMTKCPVCLEVLVDGHLLHKSLSELNN